MNVIAPLLPLLLRKGAPRQKNTDTEGCNESRQCTHMSHTIKTALSRYYYTLFQTCQYHVTCPSPERAIKSARGRWKFCVTIVALFAPKTARPRYMLL